MKHQHLREVSFTQNEKGMQKLPLNLVLIFIIAVMMPILTGHLYFQRYETDFRNTAWHQLSTITELKMNQISDWRKRCLREASVLYQNDDFSGRIRVFLENPENRTNRAVLINWMKKIMDSDDEYNRICFHDATGTERLSVPGPMMNADSVFLKYSNQATGSDKVVFGDLYRSASDEHICLFLFKIFTGTPHKYSVWYQCASILNSISIRLSITGRFRMKPQKPC
jgi:hypothetical protein